MSKIIAGVDGSAHSVRALEWALAHAGEGDTVVAVHAWQVPSAAAMEATWYNPAELEVAAKNLLDQSIAEVTVPPGVEVEARVVHGHVGHSLLDAAHGADLLVVGTRGHGGFVGLLLGSVSTYAVQHASCPVVVIPPDRRSGPERSEEGVERGAQ